MRGLAVKERENSDYNYTIIASPACAISCVQMAHFCLFPYAACCMCPPHAARTTLCRQTVLLQRLSSTFWCCTCTQCSVLLHVTLWLCLHGSRAPLAIGYCSLPPILFPPSKRMLGTAQRFYWLEFMNYSRMISWHFVQREVALWLYPCKLRYKVKSLSL